MQIQLLLKFFDQRSQKKEEKKLASDFTSLKTDFKETRLQCIPSKDAGNRNNGGADSYSCIPIFQGFHAHIGAAEA
jgi:hypothetical protein